MAEDNVLDVLRKLVALQKVDYDVFQVKKELQQKPVLITELQQEFESKKTKLKALEEEYKAVQLQRNTLEGDLAQAEEGIKKAEAQLSAIKTNKEYTAKIGEIEGLKADKSIIEERILLSYDQSDEVKAKVDAERNIVAQEEKTFLEQKAAIETEMKALEDKVAQMSGSRDHLLEGIDKTLLARYERILNNRDGLAVVPVKDMSCGGCFMNVPAQVVNEMKRHKDLVFCEMCARILYLEEDIDA